MAEGKITENLPVLPREVEQIISRLEAAGFEAYAVGGCVRDALLLREPEDWDITTSALPEQVKELFGRTVDTGIAHGTVTVLIQGKGFEVTTYRIDGEYRDGRHPDQVEFTRNLEEDLKRRDFTINAMAYNPSRGLADLFGGRADLKSGVIRCVGAAEERFSEDALRILRAVRFAGQLGFEIEEKTFEAMKKLAPSLRRISQERIQTELTKLLLSDHPERLLTAAEAGITAVVLPELDACLGLPQRNPYHCMDVGRHSVETARQVEKNKVLRWTALLHDIGKPLTHVESNGWDSYPGHAETGAALAEKILRRLKFDHDTVKGVTKLTRYHAYHFRQTRACVRKVMSLVGKEMFPRLLEVMRADTMAKSRRAKEEYLPAIVQLESLYREVLEKGECFCLPMLSVKGADLIEAGVSPGPELGEMLSAMLDWVLRRPEENDKKILISHFQQRVRTEIFREEDAGETARMIRRVLLEVNTADYPEDEMRRLAEWYTEENVCWLAEEGCLYLAREGGRILGCGAAVPEGGACVLRAIFVLPEAQKKGTGRLLLQALETDPLALEAGECRLHASLTARGFYEKMDYEHSGGDPELKDGCYEMKKKLAP